MPELTGPQVLLRASSFNGRKTRNATLAEIREMRKDPVVALVRVMFFAGILQGEWSYESESDELKEFLKEQFEPIRLHLLQTGSLGCFDFGWQPYEKVLEYDSASTMIRYKKLKPLLQDNTEIFEDQFTGAFTGFRNGGAILDVNKCLLLNFDVEGTNWRGTSTVNNAFQQVLAAQDVLDIAARYDKKVSGAHWVIKYPDGSTQYNGVQTPNQQIADSILASLQSSSLIGIPLGKPAFAGLEGSEQSWSIELITAQGQNIDFNGRLEYHDKAKARSLGFPERSILEGLHGTKAEADSHQDFVITMIEFRHNSLVNLINWHAVNQLIRMNFGEQWVNKAYIKANSIKDEFRSSLTALYSKILESPDGMLNELDTIDIESIRQKLQIPTRKLETSDATN